MIPQKINYVFMTNQFSEFAYTNMKVYHVGQMKPTLQEAIIISFQLRNMRIKIVL